MKNVIFASDRLNTIFTPELKNELQTRCSAAGIVLTVNNEAFEIYTPEEFETPNDGTRTNYERRYFFPRSIRNDKSPGRLHKSIISSLNEYNRSRIYLSCLWY